MPSPLEDDSAGCEHAGRPGELRGPNYTTRHRDVIATLSPSTEPWHCRQRSWTGQDPVSDILLVLSRRRHAPDCSQARLRFAVTHHHCLYRMPEKQNQGDYHFFLHGAAFVTHTIQVRWTDAHLWAMLVQESQLRLQHISRSEKVCRFCNGLNQAHT